MKPFNLDNQFIQELPGDPEKSNHPRSVQGAFWSSVLPRKASAPKLIAHAADMAARLDLSPQDVDDDAFVQLFSGNRPLSGMHPYATCYGGHQFGHWAGQLGDGRAIFLGEVVNKAGERWELQLKGAGLTPYSRGGDGLAVLRSSLREFLCSEAMHHLGIPTTRALSLIATGDTVIRDMFYDGNPQPEAGAVVCRVAPSFIRFGHFELFSKRGELPLLEQLLTFTLSRDFPELSSSTPLNEQRRQWFRTVCERTATLMVEWMRVGFVHGVMNTDNLSILGLTIDYGPYGWIDNLDPTWTPNTTDLPGRRYSYGRQPEVARWNLERLADALTPLMDQADLSEGLKCFDQAYFHHMTTMLAGKFGLQSWQESDGALIETGFSLMHEAEVDMTDFFRRLADLPTGGFTLEPLRHAFYDQGLYQHHHSALSHWLSQLSQRVQTGNTASFNANRSQHMNQINPRFILRNYLAQQAIEAAEKGDYQPIHDLQEVMKTPYEENPAHSQWYGLRPDWAKKKAGCSMLSCSS
ncbi:MAG: YdiU family protein [Magnetococcales bacterium]|nr:YdiU family protein [Magnetococcales bacterium]